MTVLEARHLNKSFQRGGLWKKAAPTHAVNDVSISLNSGETLAIVGESGSGKSTLARMLMHLLKPDSGEVLLHGEVMGDLSARDLRHKRRFIQMVFQDPFASLNPRMTVASTVAEGLSVHQPQLSKAEKMQRVVEVLQQCGISADAMQRYPHQFSGGQRQRIGIARALIVEPDILVLDEPVSALDVSVQAQILNLLTSLQNERDLAYVFISHDLSVVRHVADYVGVMFAGYLLEYGSVEQVFHHPRHPYTAALLAARPISHPNARPDFMVDAQVEPEQTSIAGCPFRLRCPVAKSDCSQADMLLGADGHACLYPL